VVAEHSTPLIGQEPRHPTDGPVIMPKNFGLGVTVRAPRAGGHALVRLARRDLWQRLDRSMISRARGARAESGRDQQVR
jgi:hypothetical protein